MVADVWAVRPAQVKRPDPLADVVMHEFRRQLEYKAELYDTKIVMADRFYASSKTCSDCGAKNDELRLNDRWWVCPSCGTHHDRDANAAANLRDMAASCVATTPDGEADHASRKREPGIEPASCCA